jgi:hypothetical protein
MKYCIDCKYFVPRGGPEHLAELSKCSAYFNRLIFNSVVGEIPKDSEYCEYMRSDTGDCGPEAKLFEPLEIPEVDKMMERRRELEIAPNSFVVGLLLMWLGFRLRMPFERIKRYYEQRIASRT